MSAIKDFEIGNKVPDEFNCIIEIQGGVAPVKYEIDEKTGVLVVDRFVATSMFYPCHYGFIPQTLAEDGDPVDVLLICSFPIHPGSAIKVRPIGMVDMEDEKGKDIKVICVPVDSVCAESSKIISHEQLPETLLKKIVHFFERYKDLEPSKWVKVVGFESADTAKKLIIQAMKSYKR